MLPLSSTILYCSTRRKRWNRREKKKYKETHSYYTIFVYKDIWLVKKKEEKKNLFDIYYTNTVDGCTYTLIIVELFCLSLSVVQRKEKKREFS
jgi:hypothetical protein